MSYNPRMSMAPPSTQKKSHTKKEDESDAFMRLPDKEICGCISDIGVPFTLTDLQKPNPLQIQQVFQWFAELLQNATHETIEPAMRAAASDIAGDYVDVFAPDVLNLMGFYASLRKLLFDCGVHDFSFQDLQKPSHERLSKIFSYIINFVRFRETQTNEIVRHFEKVEKTKERIELLYKENQEMEQEVEELKRLKKLKESRAQEKIQRNQELKQRLRTMLASQNEVVARYEGLQRRKDELTGLLEEKTTTAIQLRQESAKLKPYVLQSPSALQASLADLGSTLSSEKGQIEGLDRRARALQTSTDSFTLISTDVLSSIKILEEIATELAKEEEVNSKNTGQRDALSERGNNVREVEREETLLRRQLAKYVERTEKLKEQSYEKAEAARKRMEELRREHKMAVESRNEEVRGLDQRRLRIEQTEKKMANLKENIEKEVLDAREEFLKLQSNIELYITEMEKSM